MYFEIVIMWYKCKVLLLEYILKVIMFLINPKSSRIGQLKMYCILTGPIHDKRIKLMIKSLLPNIYCDIIANF